MCSSIQFHTNVSQLVRHVFPGSYTPLVSLDVLPSRSLNRLTVCLSCLVWLCISLVCTVGMYCASAASEWPWFQRGKVFFFFLTQKWTPTIKKKKNGLTSGLTRGWRQTSDVSSTPPDDLTSVLTTKSVESVTERGAGGPSLSSVSGRGRWFPTWTVHTDQDIEDRGPFAMVWHMLQWNPHCSIYKI